MGPSGLGVHQFWRADWPLGRRQTAGSGKGADPGVSASLRRASQPHGVASTVRRRSARRPTRRRRNGSSKKYLQFGVSHRAHVRCATSAR